VARFLVESDVATVLDPADALEVVAEQLAEAAESPTVRSALELGSDEMVMLAGSLEMAQAAGMSLTLGETSLALLLASDPPRLVAALEARRLRALRVAATSAAAARSLAGGAARSLGVIGCGSVGLAHVECLRSALPGLERVVLYCRSTATRERAAALLAAEAADYGAEPAACDVVVVATTSPDPVLRGEWLRPGALVCAVGGVTLGARELDNVVLERAAFVCSDSPALAREAAGDLAEPVAQGILDWLEVHDLRETLAAAQPARQSSDDIVVFKSAGNATLDLALAALAANRAAQAGIGAEVGGR
jgi:ornithine cyclodeaminase/alanine dehydrogenase-like protein (mu-crystallin family)